MWIRSQNKLALVDCTKFFVAKEMNDCGFTEITNQDDGVIGAYDTHQRALEVLDEIQAHVIGKLIIPHDVTYEMYDTQVHVRHEEIKQLPTVYEMPKE